jgi:hypothetical protein
LQLRDVLELGHSLGAAAGLRETDRPCLIAATLSIDDLRRASEGRERRGQGHRFDAAIQKALVPLGLSDVQTYINSGNVIFSTRSSDAQQLTRIAITVLVLDHKTLKKRVDAIPRRQNDADLSPLAMEAARRSQDPRPSPDQALSSGASIART